MRLSSLLRHCVRNVIFLKLDDGVVDMKGVS